MTGRRRCGDSRVPCIADVVELALEFSFFLGVGLPFGRRFQILLAVALLDIRHVHGQARVVAECPVPSSVQLELDQVLLDLDGRDRCRLPAADRCAETSQAIAMLLGIERTVHPDIHAIGRSGHINAEGDALAFEVPFDFRFVGTLRFGGRSRQRHSNQGGGKSQRTASNGEPISV